MRFHLFTETLSKTVATRLLLGQLRRGRPASPRALQAACLLLVLLSGSFSSSGGLRAASAHAQEASSASKPAWVQTFDDVSVNRIKPDDLPATREPGSMIGLRTRSQDLPRHATQEDLEELVKKTDARVLRVVAVQTPPRPYRQVPMLFFGHAVWVTPPAPANAGAADSNAAQVGEAAGARAPKPGRDTPQPKQTPPAAPVLISSLDWLSKADRVYALPPQLVLDADGKKSSSKQLIDADKSAASFRATRQSLEQMTAATGGQKWLAKHKDKLIELTPKNPDLHRNLVEMVSTDARLVPPKSAFELFDHSQQVLFKLYGFSPYAGFFLSQATIMPTHPDNPALAFYWQTDYAAILGAPLLAENGHLVAINTLQHPDDSQISLSVPLQAIASYLQQHHDSKNPEGEKKE